MTSSNSTQAATTTHSDPLIQSPRYALKESTLTLQYLMYLLRWPRPVGSDELPRFHRWIAAFAPKARQVQATPEGHLIIQTQHTHQRVFMAELTTQHSLASIETQNEERPKPQTLKLEALTGQVSAMNGEVLGADSSVGIWLLLNQLYFGVPGTYVFWKALPATRDLDWLPLNTHQLVLCGGEGDHQLINQINGRATASHEFTQGVLKQLHQENQLRFTAAPEKPTDPKSIQSDQVSRLLDQAAYSVPEVIRLSTGRVQQDDGRVTQDLHFASVLAHRLVRVPWLKLPTERDPQERVHHWLEETRLELDDDPRPF